MPDRPGLADGHIVRRVLDGDRDRFGVLVERYWNMAVALALTRIGDVAEAEDIAQEGFMTAYAHLPTLRDPARFAGWLSRIVVQESIDCRRKRARGLVAEMSARAQAKAFASAPAMADPILTNEQRQTVRQAIDRLPQKFQTVVIMRFTGGLSAKEIARQLGKRPGTVRVWLHRAYQRLRQYLDPLLEEAESS